MNYAHSIGGQVKGLRVKLGLIQRIVGMMMVIALLGWLLPVWIIVCGLLGTEKAVCKLSDKRATKVKRFPWLTRELMERADRLVRSGAVVPKAVLEPFPAGLLEEIERTEPPEQEVKRILRKIHRMTDESVLDEMEFEDEKHTVFIVSRIEFELGEIRRLIDVYEKWNECPD